MSVAALLIALISLTTTIVLGIKNYRKSKRIEFFQRLEHLFQRIADLNAKNSESHLISAKYEMVAQKLLSLRVTGEKQEQIKKQIASIKGLREGIELAARNWDDNIEHLHSMYISLTSKNDMSRVERLIAAVHVASDQLKRVNEISLASLHILESTEPSLKADLDKLEQYEIELAKREDLQKAKKELNEEAPD